MNIKVSVIIPVYNAEKYLTECMESVFSQTLKEIEIICINDGSTDKSLEILSTYENKHKNMVLIDIKNQGVAHARNLGIKLSKGEACCFMDPDDKYPANDVLYCLYNEMKANNAKICGGSAILMKDEIIIDNPNDEEKKYQFLENTMMNYSNYQWSYGFWRFMYDREFLELNNINFPLYLRYQDPPFFVQAMICAERFYAMKKATYLYRVNTKGIELTFEKTRDSLLGMIDVLKISGKEKLSELHKVTLNHINKRLCVPLFWHIQDGYIELKQLLNVARQVINFDMVEVSKNSLPYRFEVEKYLEEIKEVRKKEFDFKSLITSYETIIIYGAGYVGKKVGVYLLNNYKTKKLSYAVTKINGDETHYHGIKIVEINRFKEEYKKDALVLIATKDHLHSEIQNTLQQMEFKNIVKINYEEFQFFKP